MRDCQLRAQSVLEVSESSADTGAKCMLQQRLFINGAACDMRTWHCLQAKCDMSIWLQL